jgi:hypothetical protein
MSETPRFNAPQETFNQFITIYEAGNEARQEIDLWLESEKNPDAQMQRDGFRRFNNWLEESGFDQSGLTTALLDWLQGRT